MRCTTNVMHIPEGVIGSEGLRIGVNADGALSLFDATV